MANFIDIDNIRGGTGKRMMRMIADRLAYRLLEDGQAFIKDSHRHLNGGIDEQSVRNALLDHLAEMDAMDSEAWSQSEGQIGKGPDYFRERRRKAERGRITIQEVVSPRTGIHGWAIKAPTVKMANLRSKLIRLAHSKPELRKHVLPLLKTAKPSKEEIEKIKNTKWEDWKPVPLPDDLFKYFAKTKGAIKVPLSSLVPIRARKKGIAQANRYMWLAYLGEINPRKPVALKLAADGNYILLDGNSTYATAKANNWKYLYGLVQVQE